MKNINIIYYAVILLISTFSACNGNKQANEKIADTDSTVVEKPLNNSETDYSGVYKSDKTGKACNLTITISKKEGVYVYALTGEHYDAEGLLIIEKADAVNITFDGPIGNNAPKTVQGQITDSSILIQNYGNSMNEYHFFVECDEKFIEFIK